MTVAASAIGGTNRYHIPDHVVLEARGVSLPGGIAASVWLLQGYTLDSRPLCILVSSL